MLNFLACWVNGIWSRYAPPVLCLVFRPSDTGNPPFPVSKPLCKTRSLRHSFQADFAHIA